MTAFEQWCREVTVRVRFAPDRAAIKKELTAHYEDSVADFIRVGYDRELAENRALAAMGDAGEVGRGLDKAHSYFLGRLWQASKWTLLLSAMFAVAFMYEYHWTGMWEALRFVPQPYHQEMELTGLETVTEIPCPEDFTDGIYDYSFQYANFMSPDWNFVSVYLNAYTPRFWMKGPEMDALTAVDSLGNVYTQYSSRPQKIFGGADSARINTACIIQITLGEEWPEWIEVKHETAGWSFRLELPEEGGTP